ncbi:MAG TPA: hypothetical protein VFK03_01200, partial [Candidatus Saccharimonadales bacterium]|nr:hypothetical protein [Candidatus Saccharimonadales bacterium]
MSKSLTGVGSGLTKVVSALTSVATVLSLAGFAAVAPMATHAAVPSDYGLKEGQMISASGSNDPDIYIVNDWGYKRLFLNPVIFNMYGQLTGGFAAVTSVSAATRDAFPTSGLFRDCEVGSANNNGNVYAVEVTGEDTGVLHHVALTGDQAVAQDANFFKKVFCINDREFNWYQKGSDYSSLSQVPVYTRGTNTTPSGSFSASLSSDNPAPGSVVDDAAAVDLAHFTVSGSGVVTSMTLKRIGVSADASLSNVYLFNGNQRISDAATVTNGVISFNNSAGLFTAPMNVSVKADLAASSGETLGVQLTAINGNAVNVSGNLFTVASATLASLTVGSTNTASAPSSADAPNYTLYSSTFNVGTRDAYLKHIAFRQIGSMPTDAIQNYRLFLDGTQIATGNLNSVGDLLSFDMGSVGTLVKSGNHTIEVRGDIVKGSNRTYSFSIQNKADIVITDSQYGANISASGVPTTATSLTIPAGSVSVTTDPAFNATNFVAGVSNVTVAKYLFKGYGEDMKISQLKVSISDSSNNLDNVSLWANGSQVVSAKNYTGSDLTFDLGSSMVIPAGATVPVEIHLDTKTGSTNTPATSIQATLKGITNNAQGVSSGTVTTVPSTSGVAGPSLTSIASGLTVTKNTAYGDQTMSPNSTAVKLGSFVIQAANAEPVRISNIKITLQTSESNLNNFANLYVSDNTVPVLPQTTNNFSTNFTLQPNESHIIDVFVDA